MLTPFGKAIRKMRIEKGVRLKDMAEYLGMPSSYLSVIENGRKPIPEKMIDQVQMYFEDLGVTKNQWRIWADESKTLIKIDLTQADEMEREFYTAAGRRFKSLPLRTQKDLIKILKRS